MAFQMSNGKLPMPEDFPLATPPIYERLDAMLAELQGMKQFILTDDKYEHAQVPLVNTIRSLALLEGTMLEIDKPLTVVPVSFEE